MYKNSIKLFALLFILIGFNACTSKKKTQTYRQKYAKKRVPETTNKPVLRPDIADKKEKEKIKTPELKIVKPESTRLNFNQPETIRKTQILLYLFGYDPGKVDGTLHPETMSALSRFQSQENLPIGDMSEHTLKKLGVQLMDFDVADIQRALEKKAYDPGPVDNLVGRMTRGAFVEFTRQHHFTEQKLTEELKQALFNEDAKFNNKVQVDDLFNQQNEISDLPKYDPSILPATQAKVIDVQRALASLGYESGDETQEMTPALKNALFMFQLDRNLPVGGMNPDTLRALGFR